MYGRPSRVVAKTPAQAYATSVCARREQPREALVQPYRLGREHTRTPMRRRPAFVGAADQHPPVVRRPQIGVGAAGFPDDGAAGPPRQIAQRFGHHRPRALQLAASWCDLLIGEVPGGDEPAGRVDRVPAIGGQAHAPGRRLHARYLGAVVDPGAGCDRHAEQAVGESIGVDLALAGAPDAAVGDEPHPPLQLGGLEPFDGEAALLPERAFRPQPGGLAIRGGQVESRTAREAAVEPVRLGPAQRRDVVERGPAGVPGGHGPIGADERRELGQLRVGLIHQQPGARRGTAGARIVRVDDHDVAAGVGQAHAAMAPVTPAPITTTSHRSARSSGG